MQVNVLMTLPELLRDNGSLVRHAVESADENDFLISVDIDKPVSFVYRDPKQRFELSLPSVGSPANVTTLMLTRSTRLGTEILAVKQMELVLSDGAPLRQRAVEAAALRSYLVSVGFVPVSYDGFEISVGDKTVATLSDVADQADKIDMSAFGGGLSVFTLQQDELLFGVSIVPQLYTAKDDDYSLHVFVAEKEDGIEY